MEENTHDDMIDVLSIYELNPTSSPEVIAQSIDHLLVKLYGEDYSVVHGITIIYAIYEIHDDKDKWERIINEFDIVCRHQDPMDAANQYYS
jgi:hypothetical protein